MDEICKNLGIIFAPFGWFSFASRFISTRLLFRELAGAIFPPISPFKLCAELDEIENLVIFLRLPVYFNTRLLFQGLPALFSRQSLTALKHLRRLRVFTSRWIWICCTLLAGGEGKSTQNYQISSNSFVLQSCKRLPGKQRRQALK